MDDKRNGSAASGALDTVDRVKGIWSPRVAGVLSRAAFGYLAVQTSNGPHVTPLLFGFTPDRLWFGIGRRTLKARALAKRDSVGVVVPGETASVAVRGKATLLDWPRAAPAELFRAPLALPAFAVHNALETAAFARDVVQTGAQPPSVVPLSVRAEAIDLLNGWPAGAVLGWMASGGPIALPARWHPESQRAVVPAAPLRAAGGARTAAACLCIDESEGLGPLAKRGRLLRGKGHARVRGQVATVTLEPERVTRWTGFEIRTTTAAGS